MGPTPELDVPTTGPRPACVLIACRNGEAEIGTAVRQAVTQAPVFVVSDGSTDATAAVARAAGAEVLELTSNIGKPAAIARALQHFQIVGDFATVAVIDDDTRIAPDFIQTCLRSMRAGVAIVVGKTASDWSHGVRWNPWVAARAFAYWKYQLFIRRGQSALNVMTCISGSNSLYRTSVLAQVVSEQTPYIVDDTYWTLETHRRKLGPDRLRADGGGTHPGPDESARLVPAEPALVVGHDAGHPWTPGRTAVVAVRRHVPRPHARLGRLRARGTDAARPHVGDHQGSCPAVLLYTGGYVLWAAIGAIALKRWRLVLLAPALIVVDWIQRVNFVHAFCKTVKQPRVTSCTWSSPKRYA